MIDNHKPLVTYWVAFYLQQKRLVNVVRMTYMGVNVK
jgi:hypothetical protein